MCLSSSLPGRNVDKSASYWTYVPWSKHRMSSIQLWPWLLVIACYNWLFLWDYTFYKWVLLVLRTDFSWPSDCSPLMDRCAVKTAGSCSPQFWQRKKTECWRTNNMIIVSLWKNSRFTEQKNDDTHVFQGHKWSDIPTVNMATLLARQATCWSCAPCEWRGRVSQCEANGTRPADSPMPRVPSENHRKMVV